MLGELRFTFEANAKRALRERGEREYLAGYLEGGGLETEGKRLLGPGERQTVITELVRAHRC